MTVRRIILSKDYPVIKAWWEDRGSEAPMEALLPPIGIIAEADAVPVACGFLYEVKGAPIAIIEWEATNPAFKSSLTRIRGLQHVFNFFEGYCRDLGIKVLLSWVASERGDGRLLLQREWKVCPGERHELMCFETEAICQQP